MKGEIKIRYNDFKIASKHNIFIKEDGTIEFKKLRKKEFNKIKKIDNNYMKIPLTTKNKCECDKLIIDNYSEDFIENMMFHFHYYCITNKRLYLISIIYIKEKVKFLERLSGNKGKKYWKISVDRINENGEVISNCMTSSPGTAEGIELEKIFTDKTKNIPEKIIDFLKKHKYTNIYMRRQNLCL